MQLTKRQLTESDNRQEKIFNLLYNHAGVKNLKISYENGYICFSDDEYILGYFWSYKSLKKLQDNIIMFFNDIDHVLESEDICRKIHDMRVR